MIRLAIVAAGAFALSQTPAAQGVAADVGEFRDRQFLVGQRVGCEIQLAQAALDGDVERVARLTDACAELERQAS